MADHSNQIARHRDAAFRNWKDEMQDNEAASHDGDMASQMGQIAGDGHAAELQGDMEPVNDLSSPLRHKIAQAEPNSPARRVALEIVRANSNQSNDFASTTTSASANAAFQADRASARGDNETNGGGGDWPIEARARAGKDGDKSDSGTDLETIAAAAQKLIADLRVMKRTRFNAQERFEAKHKASVAAFTLAAVFEIGLSLAGTNFGTTLPRDVANFIEFSSQITAVFILGFGLVATLSNYQTQALYLQRCAMDWGNLSRELRIALPVSREILQDFRRRYHEIEARCPPNHAAQDWNRANLDRNDPAAKRADRIDYFFNVYLIYALTGLGYITFFGLGLWQAMT